MQLSCADPASLMNKAWQGEGHEASACSCSWVPGQGCVSEASSLVGSLPENTPSHLSQECLVSGELPDYSWLEHED